MNTQVTDTEIEELEARLDEALDPRDADALDVRLAQEPELAAAMEALRSDRTLRSDFFRTLEPEDAEADLLAARVCATAFKESRSIRPRHAWRWYAATAACLLIGFLTGWAGRNHSQHSGTALVATNGTGAPVIPAIHTGGPKVETIVTYQVALTDEAGHVTAVQNFDSLDQAQDFARDVRRWQDRRAELRAAPAPVVVADRF